MTIKSAWPDVTIPEVSITEYVLRHAERLRDRAAMIDGPSGRTLTYGQLAEHIRRVATGLARRGFRKGDVFAIYSPNLPEYAVVFNAVASLGGINTTVNPLYTAGELANQLKDSGARFLITAPPFLDKAKEAAAATGIEEIFVFGTAAGARPFAELLDAPPSPPSVTIDPHRDVVALPYSSGTTGLPKGVMLTHYNLVANLRQCEGAENFDGFKDGDVILAVMPFFHIYGMVVIMKLGLSQGGTIVSMPRFDFQEFLTIMQKYRVTIAPLVPPIVLGMVKYPALGQFDLSSVRLVFSGAAPLGEEIARALSAKLGCPVVQGYGMTEASPVTHLSPTRNAPVKPGSIGLAVPNTEVRLIGVDTGAEVGRRREGELLIRGPQIMKGYLNRPEETAAAIDGEGWYHTGDVGYVDDEGWFFIVDRTKELIKYKGMQVAPAELEAVLLTHPAVLDAAVIRKADEEAGEVPKAYVVLKADEASRATTRETITAFVAERVAPHKRIRHLEFIDQIPKSASGKILRRVLVQMDKDREAARRESLGPSAEQAASPAPRAVYRHTLPTRLAHWIVVLCLPILMLSGFQIFNAHPALYWGDRSDPGRALFALQEGFPHWATLPSGRWLAMGRRWHLFFAWVLVLTGLAFGCWALVSRHLTRDLFPWPRDLRGLGASIRDHLRFRHPSGEAATRYNVMQKLAYTGVVVGLGPLIVATGLAMSPRFDAAFPFVVSWLGGRQSARTLHFLATFAFVGFTLMHLFMVAVTGVVNNVRSMATGWYRVSGHGARERHGNPD